MTVQFKTRQNTRYRPKFTYVDPQEYKEILKAADAEVENVLDAFKKARPNTGTINRNHVRKVIKDYQTTVFDSLMPILERIALVGAREAARKAKIPIKFADVTTSFDKVRLESLQVELGKLINGISFAQMDTIEKLIQASIMHGIEPKNIAKLVDLAITAPDAGVLALGQKIEQLPPGSTNWQTIQETLEMSLTKQASKQAMTIARTETMRAANTGQATFWNEAKKDGLLTKDAKVVYIVTPDDRLCEDICEPMTGKTRSMDGHFKLPDGEQIKSPPAHPNCRCTTGIVRS